MLIFAECVVVAISSLINGCMYDGCGRDLEATLLCSIISVQIPIPVTPSLLTPPPSPLSPYLSSTTSSHGSDYCWLHHCIIVV